MNRLILINGGNAYALSFTSDFITAPVMANGSVDTSMNDDIWSIVDYDRIDEYDAKSCRAIEEKLRTLQAELDKEIYKSNININDSQERDY